MQLLDLGSHLHAQLGVEIRQRLVKQEHLRVAHDRASHRDALPLPAGELPGIAYDPLAPNTQFDLSKLRELPNVVLVPARASPFSLRQQSVFPPLVRQQQLSLYHSPYYLFPYAVRCPIVVSLHDLIPLLYPEASSRRHQRQLFALAASLAVWRADQIVVDSESTRRAVMERWHISGERVTAIPLAADEVFGRADDVAVGQARQRMGLDRPYVLHVGTNKPHKNVVRLVQAWAGVPETLRAESALVLAGAHDPRYPEARRLVEELGLSNQVRFLGRVSGSELPLLYAGAQAFVFPSLHEGFGLPVLEAMASGVPVACSNRPSLPEVAGQAALTFDPEQVSDITAALARLLGEPELRTRLSRAGREQASTFSWSRTAAETLHAYRRVAGIREETMKLLHVYKDYAPVLGGIENHIRLLAEKQAAAGNRVTVLATSRTTRTVIEETNGVHVVKAARLAHLASTPISVMLPWHLAQQRPDIAHLHYPYPVGEVSQLCFGRSQCVVLSYHADIVRQAGILRFYRPLLNRMLDRVDRILVASPQMLKTSPLLQPFREKCVLVPYGIDRRPFLASRADEARALQERYGGGPWLLFVGVLRYYKGLQYLLQAMVGIHARLMIVGDGPMAPVLRGQAQALGLGDGVVFAGRVSDRELPAYYQFADILILPSSERSEAYGLVQVEAMTSGLPVVCTELHTGTTFVNRDGESGLVVPPKDPKALAAAVVRLLEDDALRLRLGQGARARSALFAAEDMLRAVDKVYLEALSAI